MIKYSIAFALPLVVGSLIVAACGNPAPVAPQPVTVDAKAQERSRMEICANLSRISGGGMRDFYICLDELR